MSQQSVENFPTTGGSIGIFFVTILSMIVFSPVMILSGKITNIETSFMLYYVVAIGIPAIFYFKRRRKQATYKPLKLTPLRRSEIFLLILGTMGLAAGIIAPLVELIPMADWFSKLMLNMGRTTHPATIMAVVIAAPILEELIFRGVMLDGLLKRYSPIKAIIVTSLLFGAIHLNPWQFVSAFTGGLFIGWVYYRTHNLSYAILIHAVNNLFFVVPAFFIDVNALMGGGKSSLELFGGWWQYLLFVIAGIALFVVCVFSLKKKFDAPQLQ